MASVRSLCLAGLSIVAISCTACSSTQERPRQPAAAAAATTRDPTHEPDLDAGSDPAPSGPGAAAGNHGIRGFEEAKKELGRIYAAANQHTDLYCGCTFLVAPGHGMRVDLDACGYVAKNRVRAERIEWEHAVPASAFGHTFAEWREGDPRCVDSHGKRFHGRTCARIASPEFARIEADLHNLFPVVGEVNGVRSDLPMGVLDGGRATPTKGNLETIAFGGCESRIESGVFLPRRKVRGDLARAYKYMDRSYPERHLIDDAHRAVFDTWDTEDPPDAWERDRNKRIAARQGNANGFIGD